LSSTDPLLSAPVAAGAAAEATTETALVGVFRSEAGRIVATLTRLLGDIDLAEDAVQEALATALERWPRDGPPDRPGAWLMTTARNKALDHLRRERTRATAREAALRLNIPTVFAATPRPATASPNAPRATSEVANRSRASRSVAGTCGRVVAS